MPLVRNALPVAGKLVNLQYQDELGLWIFRQGVFLPDTPGTCGMSPYWYEMVGHAKHVAFKQIEGGSVFSWEYVSASEG